MAEVLGAVASGITLAALFKLCVEAFKTTFTLFGERFSREPFKLILLGNRISKLLMK